MPKDQTITERRMLESWRSRACAAGLCVGAQIFLFGTGVAMPVSLNSAWIAALATLPFSALTAACCKKRVMHQEAFSRTALVLLALTLLANAIFAAAALVSFAEQTLLEQTPVLFSAAFTVVALFLSVLSGGNGVSWLCFALRWALPVLIGVLILASFPMKIPSGLFPLLGPGKTELGVSALCMLGASSPALMLLLPPQEIAQTEDDFPHLSVPGTGFFVWRVLAGALAGTLILLCACVCTTYEAISESAEWGERLRIVASDQPHEGIPQTLLTALQMIAFFLLGVSMLSSAAQALSRVMRGKGRFRAGLPALSLLMFLVLLLLIAFGFKITLFAAPLLLPASMFTLLLCRRREKTSA